MTMCSFVCFFCKVFVIWLFVCIVSYILLLSFYLNTWFVFEKEWVFYDCVLVRVPFWQLSTFLCPSLDSLYTQGRKRRLLPRSERGPKVRISPVQCGSGLWVLRSSCRASLNGFAKTLNRERCNSKRLKVHAYSWLFSFDDSLRFEILCSPNFFCFQFSLGLRLWAIEI